MTAFKYYLGLDMGTNSVGCLRALLIRKDVKQQQSKLFPAYRLRALLIRKDVKQCRQRLQREVV